VNAENSEDGRFVGFIIEGEHFKIVPSDKINDYGDECESDEGVCNNSVAGELMVHGKKFFVICASEHNRDSCDGNIADILTKRELQVALLVSGGRVNKQIANQLKLSEWTVATHLRRIYAKLGVRTRAAMVAKIIKFHT
jgi:DNA-binding CsgD family transcriptional regulator